MKYNLEEFILEVVQSVPPPGKRNMLALYAHALAALACQKKSQEGATPFHSLAEAWNSPMAKPMREYIDVWGAGFQVSSMNEAALQKLCDSLSVVLPETTNVRAAFYACVKLLYVSQLWGRMGDVHCTTSQLSKTVPEVIFEVLSKLENGIPEEVAAKYASIAEWDAKKTTERLWPRLYGYRLEKREIRQSGKVTDGLAFLEETNLGAERKLQIYSCARLGFFLKRKDTVENPFRYLRKTFSPNVAQLETNAQGQAFTMMRGKDGALSFQSEYFSYEATFDQAIEALKTIEPVRFFLATGQYSLRRTELATELSVAVRPFLQRAHTADYMILEPNPLTVELANQLDTTCLLVFLSLETAFLYLTQFPDLNIGYLDLAVQSGLLKLRMETRSAGKGKRDNRSFLTEPIGSIRDALVFLRGSERDQCGMILALIHSFLNEDSSLDLYTPSDVLQGNAWEALPFDPQSGTILPSYQEDSVSSIRKKYVLLTMKKRNGVAEKRPDVSLYKLISVTEGDDTYLTYYPYTVNVPFDLLRENNDHGLTWYWNHYNPTKESVKQRKTREYRYSAEISLWYSWSPGSKSGRYYFSALPSQTQKTHNSISRGKRLTKIVQYQAATEEAAIAKVAAGLDRKDFKQTIQKELAKLHKSTGMSFKSYYYCCRDELAEKPSYNWEIADKLFNSEAFDKLRTSGVYTLEEYQQIMEGIFSSLPNKIVQLQYWEQLNLLLLHAERMGHIDRNPVGSFVYASREKDEQYRAVRAGLSKKSFTLQEERELVDYLDRELPENSLLLGCAIRFFVGMGGPEILALTWGDFSKLTFLDAGCFFITKTMKKKTITWYSSDDPKVRRIPCCPQLYEFLKRRKEYVEKALNHSAGKISDLPIVSANNTDFAKRASEYQLRTATARFIRKAGISESMIRLPTKDRQREQDINDYHGELLRANYEYRATETCRMTPGEIAYILGRQPPDTFSKHYCDYGNIESQTILVRKLMRWDALRRRKEPPQLYHTEERPIPTDEALILRGRTYDRPYLTEVWLKANPTDSGAVRLEIVDQSGADVTIISED